MNKAIAEKWTKALRSGEYTQGKKCLNDGKNMCCLGVLTDLYIKENGGGWLELAGYITSAGIPALTFEGSNIYLPLKVQKWADAQSSSGDYGNADVVRCLSADNDDGKSFEEIANIIEQNVEKL